MLFQGTGGVVAGGASGQQFVVPTSVDTRLDVAVDWTSTSSLIGVYVISGECTLDQFNARTCTFLLRSEPSSAKPRTLSASNIVAGTYTLVVADFAAFDESIAAQVVLSSASCPAVATAGPAAARAPAPTVRRFTR